MSDLTTLMERVESIDSNVSEIVGYLKKTDVPKSLWAYSTDPFKNSTFSVDTNFLEDLSGNLNGSSIDLAESIGGQIKMPTPVSISFEVDKNQDSLMKLLKDSPPFAGELIQAAGESSLAYGMSIMFNDLKPGNIEEGVLKQVIASTLGVAAGAITGSPTVGSMVYGITIAVEEVLLKKDTEDYFKDLSLKTWGFEELYTQDLSEYQMRHKMVDFWSELNLSLAQVTGSNDWEQRLVSSDKEFIGEAISFSKILEEELKKESWQIDWDYLFDQWDKILIPPYGEYIPKYNEKLKEINAKELDSELNNKGGRGPNSSNELISFLQFLETGFVKKLDNENQRAFLNPLDRFDMPLANSKISLEKSIQNFKSNFSDTIDKLLNGLESVFQKMIFSENNSYEKYTDTTSSTRRRASMRNRISNSEIDESHPVSYVFSRSNSLNNTVKRVQRNTNRTIMTRNNDSGGNIPPITNSVETSNTLNGFSEGLGNVTDSMSNFVSKLASAAAGLLETLNPVNIFSGWIGSLNSGLQGLISVINPISALFKGINKALAPVLSRLMKPLEHLGFIIGKALIPVVEALIPVFTGLAYFVAGIWKAIATVLNMVLGIFGVQLKTINFDESWKEEQNQTPSDMTNTAGYHQPIQNTFNTTFTGNTVLDTDDEAMGKFAEKFLQYIREHDIEVVT